MSRILPPDEQARVKIEAELDKNYMVEAGAGSGKTSSLVKRMVSQVVQGNFKVGEIAAITFTRKAAAELRERFQNKLEETYRKSHDSVISARLEQALLDLDQSFLGTIHSFCAKLLRERPVEAGLDPEFEELDDVQSKMLAKKAWEEYLLAVKLKDPIILEQLSNIGVSPVDLEETYVNLSDYPDVVIAREEREKPDLTISLDPLVHLLNKAQKAIPQKEPNKGYDKLQKSILKALRQLKYYDLTQDASVVSILSGFEKEASITQNRWNSKEEAKQYRDEFNQLAQEVISPVLTSWREYCHYHIMEFVLPATEHFSRLRAQVSQLNFQDLLMKTAAMLRDYPEVREYFQSKYRSLLVDEFQDTDPIQSEIMFYLSGTDTGEKDWQKLMPKPGSLFIVGDPKQSIYRFRRADIDTYNLVKDVIVASGGEVLKLTANFRSLETLGRWFNPVFQKLLPKKGDSYQAGFSPLDTMRPDEGHTASGVKTIEIPDIFTKKDEIVATDAEYIARYIKWALAGNISLARSQDELEEGLTEEPRPKDFMIITRYKDLMDVYARALEKYDIPVAISGGSSLSESQEIQEFFEVLKTLADPDNQVTLVSVLRGLFFGISDNALYQFKREGGRFNIFSTVPEGLSDEMRKQFTSAFEKLKEYYRISRVSLPTVTLEKIAVDLGLIPYTLTGTMGKSSSSYIFQLMELLRKAQVGGATGFAQIVEQIDAILETDLEEELNLIADEQDAVRLMNLHKAKGLEAPVVFLAHPFKKTEGVISQHVQRIGSAPQGHFLLTKSKGFSRDILGQPVNWSDYEGEERIYLEAEETRLLYVAATRAKNMLVISRSNKDLEMKKNPWAPLLNEVQSESCLTIPEVEVEEEGDIGAELTLEEIATAREQFRSWLPQASSPSYLLESPSNLLREDKLLVKREHGGGMAWGTVIHQVFEEVINGTEEIEEKIDLILSEQGEPEKRRAEVLEVVEKFKQSELWQRIENAQIKLAEIPFSLKVDKDNEIYERLQGEGESSFYLTGVIDLVYKDQNGWVIVDFKTDRAEGEEDYQLLTNAYSDQVQLYCQVWEQLTGEEVTSGELYFTSLNETRVVK